MRFFPYAVVMLSAGLQGCSAPLLEFTSQRPAMVQTHLLNAGVTDQRSQFRSAFCALVKRDLRGSDARCDQWLTRLSDEGAPIDTLAPVPKGSFDIVLVGGIFGECLGARGAIFRDALDTLQRAGYHISTAPVLGRGSSAHNAGIIRQHILAQAIGRPHRRTLIVSYSKGTSDTITALSLYPDLASSVAAVISFAGVVNGSPFADAYSALYRATFARLPLSRCAVSERDELLSISREYRQNWLSTNTLPKSIAYFSIVAAPAPHRVSSALRPFHRRLSSVNPMNDGQVVFYDAVIPGSTVLAYVNADHLAIALPVEPSDAGLLAAALDKNHYPRSQLLQAAIYWTESALDQTRPLP